MQNYTRDAVPIISHGPSRPEVVPCLLGVRTSRLSLMVRRIKQFPKEIQWNRRGFLVQGKVQDFYWTRIATEWLCCVYLSVMISVNWINGSVFRHTYNDTYTLCCVEWSIYTRADRSTYRIYLAVEMNRLWNNEWHF